MDITMTTDTGQAEREELRKVVRAFLDDCSSEEEVRRLMETDEGHNPTTWSRMANEIGLQALAIPEAYGGAGYGSRELAVVFETMGAALLPSPFFSTVALATPAILAAGQDASARLLPAVAAGERIATLAIIGPDGSWDLDDVPTAAERDGSDWRLTGTTSFVTDGHVADLLLIVARSPEGLGVFELAGDAGPQRTQLDTLDRTRRMARLDLDGVAARPLGDPGGGEQILAQTLPQAIAAMACEQVGGAQHVLDMAVAYASVREQFGRPIGSFQAIKHKCADMLLGVETARSAARAVVEAIATEDPELLMIASVAKTWCSEVYRDVAAENIQVHGGIGFTWEHPAHLYLKRAKASEVLLGSPSYHRDQITRRAGMLDGVDG